MISTHTEDQCEFVSTCGLSFLADYKPIYYSNRNISYPWNAILSKDFHIIFIKSHPEHATFLIKNLHLFNSQLVIIMNGEDTIFPNDMIDFKYQSFFQSNKVLAVFAQNCCINKNTPSNFFTIPIGIDYHTINWSNTPHIWGGYPGMSAIEQENILKKCIKNSTCIKDSDPKKVYTNFQHSMDNPPRRAFFRKGLYSLLANKSWMHFLNTSTREDFWKQISDKVFVLSPPGNGLDTHRTWEVLMLGKIPIIQKLEINTIFQDLPVWEIDDWKKFSNLSENDLILKHEEFCKKWHEFKFEKLTLKYWKNFIHQNIHDLIKKQL
jgi:hypothetical protein